MAVALRAALVVCLAILYVPVSEAQRGKPVRVAGPPYVVGEMVVGPQATAPSSSVARLASRYRMLGSSTVPRVRAHVMRLRSTSNVNSVPENISRRPEVRFADPNYTRRVLLAARNDPAYNNLDSSVAVWDLSDATWYQWGMHITDAPGGWNVYPNTYHSAATKPANPPKVAVVDTGIDHGGTDSSAQPGFISSSGEQSAVDVDILNIAGRVIRRLSSDAVLPAGVNRVVWDGVSNAGTRVPSGTYFVKLTVCSEDGRQASRTCALSVNR